MFRNVAQFGCNLLLLLLLHLAEIKARLQRQNLIKSEGPLTPINSARHWLVNPASFVFVSLKKNLRAAAAVPSKLLLLLVFVVYLCCCCCYAALAVVVFLLVLLLLPLLVLFYYFAEAAPQHL